MKKTAILWIIILLMLSGAFDVFAANAPNISAKSTVLIDAESGAVLYGKNEHERRGMASTTKIMTALVALENASLSDVVTVAPEACGVEGSSVYLFPEEQITMETLLYALMLQSANDAAEAIAYAVSGSVEGFVALMNEKAQELGLTDTHFDNPHGLDGATHYTTALELAKITAQALKNETLRQIVGTEKKAIPLHNGEATRLLVNHNRLLRDYDDVIGVKTGYTRACGRTLVSAAEQNGVMLICVTLDDGNDWADHRALLDYGFSLYESITLADIGDITLEIPVCGGVRETVSVCNTVRVEAALPMGRGDITTVIELPRFVYGGISEGQVIGTVRFFENGYEIGSAPLISTEDVPEAPKKQNIFKKWLSFFLEWGEM
jgi:D-alanyl-D-alanine carboxypeptidase/D-alanyl-D-alanine carboxypeptidase (penicillin-binding protein 5/6)